MPLRPFLVVATVLLLPLARPGVGKLALLQRQSLEIIRVALEGRDPYLAGVAVRYTQNVEESWVEGGLRTAAAHPDPSLRVAALYALIERSPAEGANLLRKALADPREAQVVRLAAAEKLPRLGGRSSQGLFTKLLADPDATIRVVAAGALLELGDRSGLTLLQAALRGDDLELRVDAASEFLDTGVEEEKALAVLADVLAKPAEPIARSNAAYALGETQNPGAAPLLIEALKDADRGVRLAAADSLALANPRTAHVLIEIVVRDPDDLVRLEAIHGLAQSGGEKAARALRQVLADAGPTVRLAAAAALGSQGAAGDPELIRLVKKEMEGPYYAIRLAAISALGKVGAQATARELGPLLADPDPATRLASAITVHQILARQ